MERPAELPEIVADLAEMEVVEPLREHVAVAAGLPAVAPVLGQVSPSGAAERGALDDWAVLNVSSMTYGYPSRLTNVTSFDVLRKVREASTLPTLVISEMIGTPPNAI